MPECNFQCRQEERILHLENGLTELKAEMRIYIRQLTDGVSDMKSVINSLRNKQLSENDVKTIVHETLDTVEQKSGGPIFKITMEVLKMLGTALAIIGGMQIIG